MTYEEAFDAANDFYKDIFGKIKYSNYQSFRQVRDREKRPKKPVKKKKVTFRKRKGNISANN